MGTRGGTRVGDWLVERGLGWYVPRFVSLPLLLVLALFRALRFQHGLAWLGRGGVGLFYWIDTVWLVAAITLLCTLAFGRNAYGFGVFAGLVLFLVLHSLIAHAADGFAGYSPAEEFMRQGAGPRDGQGSSGPGGPVGKKSTDDDAGA